MLEQQIEKLNERVASLEGKQDRSNDLLADILSAIRHGGLPPAPSVAVAVDNTAEEQTDEAPAEQEGDANEDVAGATVEDVRDALMNYRDVHGKDATVELMSQFLPKGAKPVVGGIPEAKFGDVIAACMVEEKAAA